MAGKMTLDPDFREFIQPLNDKDVRYLIVGGYAVAAHGHPRYTKDIDSQTNNSPSTIHHSQLVSSPTPVPIPPHRVISTDHRIRTAPLVPR